MPERSPICRGGATLVAFAAAFVLAVAAFVLAMPRAALAESEPAVAEAQEAIVVDADGNVLWSKNADDEVPMASITKIMTAMVALDSGISMDTVVTIQDGGLPSTSQLAGLEAGSTCTFGDLMQVMLVYSANDAAYNIACAVAGSEDAFVKLMNEKAKELGLTHTHFANAHGLEEDGHHSSASDLVVMGRYALENYDYIAQAVCQPSCTITVDGSQKTFESTDALIGTPGACGIKTGATEYGYSFLGACSRHGVRIYSVVLGCPSKSGRFMDTLALWDWAYDRFTRSFGSSSAPVAYVPFADHFGLFLEVSLDSDASGVVDPTGGDLSWSRTSLRRGLLALPGQPMGTVTWKQGDRLLCMTTLSASATPLRLVYMGDFDTWLFNPQLAA